VSLGGLDEDLVSRGSLLKRGLNMWDLSPPMDRVHVQDFRLEAAEFKESFQVI
jgi:hypothetical protein